MVSNNLQAAASAVQQQSFNSSSMVQGLLSNAMAATSGGSNSTPSSFITSISGNSSGLSMPAVIQSDPWSQTAWQAATIVNPLNAGNIISMLNSMIFPQGGQNTSSLAPTSVAAGSATDGSSMGDGMAGLGNLSSWMNSLSNMGQQQTTTDSGNSNAMMLATVSPDQAVNMAMSMVSDLGINLSST